MAAMQFLLAVTELLLEGVSLWFQESPGPPPVKLTVHFESLCPDSYEFVVKQLCPIYLELKDIMMVELLPYGKATDVPTPEGGYNFTCQHGPEECEGNKVLACALHYITDRDQVMNFTECIMETFTGALGGPECAEVAGVDYRPIEECANSLEGEVRLHEVGLVKHSLRPSLFYVPWIIINDVFDYKVFLISLDDLKRVVCNNYAGQKPLGCRKQ